jgi:hypothetical protein
MVEAGRIVLSTRALGFSAGGPPPSMKVAASLPALTEIFKPKEGVIQRPYVSDDYRPEF